MPENSVISKSAFAQAVYKGLTVFPKQLPSMYIYDEKGDALFQKIMQMDEYYLTRCEMEILQEHGDRICEAVNEPGTPFNLV